MAADVGAFFVVDGAALERQAVLLSATLRHHNPDLKLYAYIAPDKQSGLDPACRAALAATGTEIRDLPAPRKHWARPYPHGNKILAAASPRDCEISVFLDTDMVAVAPFDPEAWPTTREVSVVPEGVASWGHKGDRWERAYRFFDLPFPEERVRLTRRGREFVPYFNAGFVAFREADRVEGRGFGALWLETASLFDHKMAIGQKRPWLDQITLPLTLRRFGFAHRVLDDVYNKTISRRLPKPEDPAPRLLHYHRGRYLVVWPQWADVLEQSLSVLPAAMRDSFHADLLDGGFRPDPDTEAGESLQEVEPEAGAV